MISSRAYLLRAIYDWIVDSGLTPYVLVDAEAESVTVPAQYIQDGRIILNISPEAVRGLTIDNDWVMFSARFSGVSMNVSFPPRTALAIYAKENGRGMVFSDEDDDMGEPEPPTDPNPPATPSKGKPSLRVVK